MDDVPPQRSPVPNPFSPDFGQAPASLVGRDDLLADIETGLAAGPADIRFTSVLLGVRGTGKTVALSEIEDRAKPNGWVVLSIDASTPGLLSRISNAIAQVSRDYESLGLESSNTRKSKERSTEITLGPYRGKWSEQEFFDPNFDMGLLERLTMLARTVEQFDASVLLTVDELHAADREEARRLANDLQMITKRQQLPLAFVGAGLLEMKYTLLEDKRNTFLRRCNRYEMPPLTYPEAIKGLRFPIEDAGGQITREALELGASAVGDLPYTLQVIGHTAWTVADAPNRIIDEYAVEQAISIAEQVVDENISESAFYELSDREQEFLIELAALGGTGSSAAIARQLGLSDREGRKISRRLTLSGYVNKSDRGTVTLTNLVPARVIPQDHLCEDACTQAPNMFLDTDTSQPRTEDLCRKWMPRAKARCVLPPNHRGGCRSKL